MPRIIQNFVISAICLGLNLFPLTSWAVVVMGPVLDGRADVEPAASKTVTLPTGHFVLNGPGTTQGHVIPDTVTVIVNSSTAISVIQLAYDELSPNLEETLDTIIMGVAIGGPSSLATTGFTDPFVLFPVSPVEFFGNSGRIYYADFHMTTLSDLPMLLLGYDLTEFSGDPNSIVYVAQAILPLTDFNTVPEPTPLGLLGIGVAGLAGLRFNRLRKFD